MENNSENNQSNNQPTLKNVLIIALASLVFGSLGGVFGALNLANQSWVQKAFESSDSVGAFQENRTINLKEDSAIKDVVKSASPAVVSIVVSKELQSLPSFRFDPFGFFGNQFQQPDDNSDSGKSLQEVGAGSGFFVSKDGLIVTNKHVVSDAKASYTVVTNDGKNYEAKVLALDPINDFALVKIETTNAPFLQFSDSSQIELGQQVVAIGNSLGEYQNTVTSGIVSGIGRSIVAGDGTGSEQLEGVIQTDAAINPGNSGGPLLNLAGQVIGINTAVDRQGQLVGFAIPANDAKMALQSFQQNGKISRPYLGVRYVMLNKQIAEEQKLIVDYGALIIGNGNRTGGQAVLPGSPADKAGLKSEDIILTANGTKLDEEMTLAKFMKSAQPGQKINLTVLRGGSEIKIEIEVGESN